MIKPLSPNERLYLACEPLYPPFLIQFKVIGEGEIPLEEMQLALDKAGAANPGSRLALDGSNWIDSHQAPRVRKSPIDHTLIHTPIEKATAEVVIDANEILFRAFHGIMDARGLLLWVEDIFRALRGEALRGTNSLMTDREAVLSRRQPREKPQAKFPAITKPKSESHWSFIEVPNEPSQTARVAKALTQIAQAKTKFMVPVDLRPFFPEIKTTGNFSNPIFIEVEPAESTAQIQASLLRKLSQQAQFATSATDGLLNYVPLAAQRVVATQAQRHMDKTDRYLVTAVLSNLGRIELARLSTRSFKATRAISLPLDTPFCPLTIVMTEHDHGTELAISAKSASFSQQLKRELTQEIRGEEAMIGHFFDHFKATERVAITHGERQLTYRELDRWSSNVATTFPRVPRIAVEMNHSIELIVTLLAILKSGAAFVPIDPSLPKERRELIASSADHVVRTIYGGPARCRQQRPLHTSSRRAGLCHLYFGFNRSAERRRSEHAKLYELSRMV